MQSQSRNSRIRNVTLAGSIVNLLLLIFKFVAGAIGHSSAMIADAFHSLSDFASDIVVLIFTRVSGRASDATHQYGHGKFETLAAIIIGIMLFGAGVGILLDGVIAVAGFYRGASLALPNSWALAAAIISIIVKEWLYQYTIRAARIVDSPALAANAWHHRSDAITSIAALLGIGGAMLLGPAWAILDPLAAILVSAFIIKTAITLVKPGFEELLEKSLPEAEKARIAEIIAATPNVLGFHNLRTRRIGPSRAIEAHIKLKADMSLAQAHDIASSIEKSLKAEFGANTHVGIHMEPLERVSCKGWQVREAP